MFSLYTKEEYLRARRRQERIAENLSSSNPTEMQINAFLSREERLQAYEFVNCKTGKDAILTVEIDEHLLFKVCLKARLAKMAVNDYIEGIIDKAVDK